MTEKLTTWNDEQLRGLADHADSLLVRDLAGGFLALRAECAKATQSDIEQTRELVANWHSDGGMRPRLERDILALLASIRAEGSAEREKLEAALEDANGIADKLANALAKRALAQPSESGATE